MRKGARGMEIKIIPVGRNQANCYIVYDRETGASAVIDPGAEAGKILAFISENDLKVGNIFLTHGHYDHILAAQQIKDKTGARIVIHEADAPCLESAHAALYTSIVGEPFTVSKADIKLKNGEKTLVGTVEAEFIHTPGHTPGSMCIRMDNALFTGDTLFAGDIGRTDLPRGDDGDMDSSLRTLYFLGYDYIVYPGHGEPTTLGMERDNNDFLRRAAGVYRR